MLKCIVGIMANLYLLGLMIKGEGMNIEPSFAHSLMFFILLI